MKNKFRATIVGDGGWGTTLSILLSKKGFDVCLWGAFADYIQFMRKARINKKFLSGIRIPRQVYMSADIEEAIRFSNTIIVAVPSQHLRGVVRKMKPYAVRHKVFLSAAKGIEEKTLLRMSEVVSEELGRVDLAVLSGPNISFEVARGLPAVAVVASRHAAISEHFQDILMSKSFRVYTNDDVVGVELGGSLKNIIALACGIADGLGLGSNAKSALLTRGLVEMSRLGVAMGARRHTFFGASGLGDLVTTCWSSHSRNRYVGEQIGRGKALRAVLDKMQMVAEGVLTTKAAYQLSKRYNIDMPITREIFLVLFQGKPPRSAVRDLMLRAKKTELS